MATESTESTDISSICLKMLLDRQCGVTDPAAVFIHLNKLRSSQGTRLALALSTILR